MGYAIVVGLAGVAGVAAYAITLRRYRPHVEHSFDPHGPEPVVSAGASEATYIPVGADARVSWQSRSVSLLALVALILTIASAIAVTLYQFGGMLIRFIIHKLAQTS